jgi:hypothetical protein
MTAAAAVPLPRETVVLVSGFGDDGYGGLFAFDG